MPEAFYLPDPSDQYRFESTELTRGGWSSDSQHAGLPAALLGHALETFHPRTGFQIGRMSVEILGPIPIEPLSVRTRVVRTGRSVELLEGVLAGGRGAVMTAQAWRFRLAEDPLDLPAEFVPTGQLRGPNTVAEQDSFLATHTTGFHAGIEFRFIAGSFATPGAGTCWIRLRYPVVAGTTPSPLERTLVAADSANGIGSVLDWSKPRIDSDYLFINTDLTVNLHRPPEGEWVCVDAVPLTQRHGIGLMDSALFDVTGPLGRATQTLFIGHRRGARPGNVIGPEASIRDLAG